MSILISQSGKQSGPFTVTELQSKVDRGEVSRGDFAWWEGLAEWVLVEKVEGLSFPTVSSSLPIQVTAADLVPVQQQTFWRPRLPGALELCTGGLIDPIFHTLNWAKLKNWQEVRTSIAWVIGMFVFASVLRAVVMVDYQKRHMWFLAWLFVLAAWHTVRARKLTAVLKAMPTGTIRWRSTKPYAWAVIVLFVCIWVTGYFSYQRTVLELSTRQTLNEMLKRSGATEFECVDVRLGDQIADRLYRADAVIDTGELIPLTVKVMNSDLSTERLKRTLLGYVGIGGMQSMSDQISVKVNGRQLFEDNGMSNLLR
ncbi:MAG: domain 2 [Akkermansiaceae bacterium]|nr:domain 2 [Akkermansiaceae bacterium]